MYVSSQWFLIWSTENNPSCDPLISPLNHYFLFVCLCFYFKYGNGCEYAALFVVTDSNKMLSFALCLFWAFFAAVFMSTFPTWDKLLWYCLIYCLWSTSPSLTFVFFRHLHASVPIERCFSVTSVNWSSNMCESNIKLIHSQGTWVWLLTKRRPSTSTVSGFPPSRRFVKPPRPRFNWLWHLIPERPSLFVLHFASTHHTSRTKKKKKEKKTRATLNFTIN